MSRLVTATPAHASAMAAIHAAAFALGERWGMDAMAIQVALPGAFGFIDPDGAMILARVAADEAEILTLATIPALRRQGRGRELLAAAQASAISAGARTMFLEVSEANDAARGLYAAMGYRQIGRRPRYYGETAALALRLDLPAATP